MSKRTGATEATEATEAIRVGMADLISHARAAAAVAIETMRTEGLRTAMDHLDAGQIQEAAAIIGTAAVLAELTLRKMAAADDIADDDEGKAEAARASFRAARDGIAQLGGIEPTEPVTYSAADVERKIVVGALAATLVEQFPSSLKVDLSEETAANMARQLVAATGAMRTDRSSRAHEGIGSSNRRQTYHVAAAAVGCSWELNLKGGSLAGHIDISGHLVATAYNGLDVRGGDVLGVMHATKNPSRAQMLADGRYGYVGTVGLLASLLTCDITGNQRASVAGWDKVVLTTGPNAGKTLNDSVPFPGQ